MQPAELIEGENSFQAKTPRQQSQNTFTKENLPKTERDFFDLPEEHLRNKDRFSQKTNQHLPQEDKSLSSLNHENTGLQKNFFKRPQYVHANASKLDALQNEDFLMPDLQTPHTSARNSHVRHQTRVKASASTKESRKKLGSNLNHQKTLHPHLAPGSIGFYRDVLQILNRENAPYLVGGAFALNHYVGINRHTKDFDLFIARKDYEKISLILTRAGYPTEILYPHWLAKARHNGHFIDLVFSSGNGVAEVDDIWFEHSEETEIFGVKTRVCPVEEIIWSKAYIMERERFDGADIAHLILARGDQMDWNRLMHRFTPHWRLLLSHLILFGMIYPAHRDAIPRWVMQQLLKRLEAEFHAPTPIEEICGGTLLSREQYLRDIQHLGFIDARIWPHGNMSESETTLWTDAIPSVRQPI